MACENDKCEKYGMHHEYKDGVEIRKCQFCASDNQPERSKREDSEEVVIRNRLCQNCMFPGIDNQICKACGQIINRPEMRYSEHDGNIVSEVQ